MSNSIDTNLGCVLFPLKMYGGVYQARKENLYYYHNQILKERGVIMDNNKVLLSNLKYYPKMKKLLKIQEELANNKVYKKQKQ